MGCSCPPSLVRQFLGDFVDRGAHSLETICLLLALKIEHPRSVHLIRGNHEVRAGQQWAEQDRETGLVWQRQAGRAGMLHHAANTAPTQGCTLTVALHTAASSQAADINALFGFRLECLERLGDQQGLKAWQRLNTLFNWLPLAALIEDKVRGNPGWYADRCCSTCSWHTAISCLCARNPASPRSVPPCGAGAVHARRHWAQHQQHRAD